MKAVDAPDGEKAIHAALEECVMARAYHDARNPRVAACISDAFDALLDALHEHRVGTKTQRVTVRLDADTMAALDDAVTTLKYLDRSHVVRAALHHFLHAKEPRHATH